MTLTPQDEELLAQLFDGDKIDFSLCKGLLERLADAKEPAAKDLREMISTAVALMRENAEFEAETGTTLHEYILKIIASGEHQDVVGNVIANIESRLSQLPAHSRAAGHLRKQLDEYLDAIQSAKPLKK
jgi:hypothetical protein